MKKTFPAITVFLAASVMAACSDKTSLKADDLAYAAPACAYKIQQIGSELLPVDAHGQRIGFFERHPDGKVQLTTAEGHAPVANECIERAGFSSLIGSIPPYSKPAA
jgi:hypothetical protein